MKIISIVGARPNFLKLDPKLKQIVIHTGQHYDKNMSDIFLKGFKVRYSLNCKSVGTMIDKLRPILKKENPDLVLIFGDTNSSLAGALASAYEKIKVVHIESGLRSFTNMPEEINRMIIDRLSTLRLCPNNESLLNLIKEGLEDHSYIVGDPLVDTLSRFLPIKKTKDFGKYILVTIHRECNANKDFIENFLDILGQTNEKYIFPVHPRLKKILKKIPKNVKVIEPQGYKKMLELESNAKKIITDSGGVQREGAWMNVPVILMREETEWNDLVKQGSVKLSNLENLKSDIENFKGRVNSSPVFGVNKKIREIIYKYI